MSKDRKRERTVDRRNFLRIFPGLMSRRAAEFKESIPGAVRRVRSAARRARPPALPAPGAVVDGAPLVHPWIGAAQAIAAARGRRRSLPFLLGATGEAFSFFYSREDPDGAAELSPGNTFLLALALTGIGGRAAPGGPFEPALGGVEVALGKGLTVAIAAGEEPAVLLAVDREGSRATWARPGAAPAEISLEELREAWREGRWPGGRTSFLRVTLDPAAERPPAEVLGPALPAAVELLARESAGEFLAGPAGWAALAEDLRDGLPEDRQSPVLGRILPRAAAARRAAGDFLEEIVPIVAGELRGPVEEAARDFREIHAPSIEGKVFGTGLIPEAADCLLTGGRPDPEKREDPALRARAAEILTEIREREIGIASRLRAALES